MKAVAGCDPFGTLIATAFKIVFYLITANLSYFFIFHVINHVLKRFYIC